MSMSPLKLVLPQNLSGDREEQRINSGINHVAGLPQQVDEVYSKKVFIGGLPPDIDENGILLSFCVFGKLSVEWPGKTERPQYMFPPKGFAFLLFELEISVRKLINACIPQDGCFYYHVSSLSVRNKLVEVRPWLVAHTYFFKVPFHDLIKCPMLYPAFAGGIPRTFTSWDLVNFADRTFGQVIFAGIVVDTQWKYPRGCGIVIFSDPNNYRNAIQQKFVTLNVENKDHKNGNAKHMEFKPLLHGLLPGFFKSFLKRSYDELDLTLLEYLHPKSYQES